METRRETTAISLVIFFAFLLMGGVITTAQAQQIQVTAADPPSTAQGTLNLNVKVTGKGFKNGAQAKWFVTGTTNPGGVIVNATAFVNSGELTANITVDDTATIANFDIAVTNPDGRGGKGTELFKVTEKGGNASCPPIQPAPTSDTKCYAVSAGCLDTMFGTSGFVTTDPDGPTYSDIPADTVVQSDGKIIVTGQTTNQVNGTGTDFIVLRYNPDGTLDIAFGDPDPLNPSLRRGYVVTPFTTGVDLANTVVLQPDGKIVVGGWSSPGDMAVARYNTDGTLDATFGSAGKVVISFGSAASIRQIVIQSDHKLILAGQGGAPSFFAVVRLNPNGTLDSSFGTGGKVVVNPSSVKRGHGEAWTLGIQRIPAVTGEERIVVGGWSTTGPGAAVEWTMMRFKANGATDTSFGLSGRVTTSFFGFGDQLRRLAIDSANRIVAAGFTNTATNCGNYVIDFAIVRYTQDGSLDVNFSGGKQTVDIYGGNDNLYGLAIQPDGKLLIAGSAYSSDQTVKDFALVRFNDNGTRDFGFGLLGNGIVTTDFYGHQDYAYAVAVQPTDGKIVVTGSIYVNSTGDIGVARFWW
ncbi:MAG: hypothetical protein ACRD9S_03175 [Pyrinomonadaceae bacterium]